VLWILVSSESILLRLVRGGKHGVSIPEAITIRATWLVTFLMISCLRRLLLLLLRSFQIAANS
jgi:hypothetical protein